MPPRAPFITAAQSAAAPLNLPAAAPVVVAPFERLLPLPIPQPVAPAGANTAVRSPLVTVVLRNLNEALSDATTARRNPLGLLLVVVTGSAAIASARFLTMSELNDPPLLRSLHQLIWLELGLLAIPPARDGAERNMSLASELPLLVALAVSAICSAMSDWRWLR